MNRSRRISCNSLDSGCAARTTRSCRRASSWSTLSCVSKRRAALVGAATTATGTARTRPGAAKAFWCGHDPTHGIEPGTRLVVALRRAGTVHWGVDGWKDVRDAPTRASGLGLHVAELPTDGLAVGHTVELTWRDGATG